MCIISSPQDMKIRCAWQMRRDYISGEMSGSYWLLVLFPGLGARRLYKPSNGLFWVNPITFQGTAAKQILVAPAMNSNAASNHELGAPILRLLRLNNSGDKAKRNIFLHDEFLHFHLLNSSIAG